MEKAGFYEASYAVLGIIRDPRFGVAGVVDDFTENVDIMPTLCDAMGIGREGLAGRRAADRAARGRSGALPSGRAARGSAPVGAAAAQPIAALSSAARSAAPSVWRSWTMR